MLYIFLVDTGNMLQVDMNLAVETVGHLKSVLEAQTGIPVAQQILLISGGESCDEEEKVCKYTAGTDTNPIFLFSMSALEDSPPQQQQSAIQQQQNAMDTSSERLKKKVDSALSLPDASSTVAIRAAIAQEFVESSLSTARSCETLIHDQHLQHQGWSAVIANLEDTASALSKRTEKFTADYKVYLKERHNYKALVEAFDDDIALLDQIPVFPSLLRASSDGSMVGSILPGEPYDHGRSVSLLEWISERGSNQSLEQVADSCFRTLTTMDEEQVVRLEGNAASAIEGSKNISMKEIRGLGDRLSQLEQLSLEAKRIVKEQSDLAYAFLQNQQRALNLKDPSILPDLCDSHRQQLIVMSENYKRVVSIRDRCTNAKNELSSNLLTRLKWIVFIQNKIADAAQEIVINFESLRRLYKKLEVMEQLHLAPSMFLTTAVEVVRRKAFSNGYLKQTDELSHKFDKIYSEEIGLRHSFTSKLKKHFIYRMFPGLEDNPPSFATRRPKSFDEELPDITLEDIEELRKKLPDLASYLQLPEEKALDHLLNRSLNNECFTEQDGRTQNSLQTMALRLPVTRTTPNDLLAMSVMNPLPFDNKGGLSSSSSGVKERHPPKTPHSNSFTTTYSSTSSSSNQSSSATNKRQTVITTISDSSGVEPNSSSSDGSSLKTPPLLQSSTTTTSQPPLCRLRRELQDIREDVKSSLGSFEADVLKGLREQILGQLGRVFEPMNADLTRLRSELEALSNKGDGELEDLRIEKEEELKVSVRKMVLEHELEMDNLKVELSNKQEKALIDAAVQSTETSDQQLSLKSEEITQLKSNLSDLEAQRDDLLAEKERIVSILESGFIQREKLSIKTREEELRALFDSELIEAKEALTQELEEGFASKAAAASEGFKANLARMEADKEAEWRARLETERKSWLERKSKEIQAEVERANIIAKKEIDVLRSRFKIMQASGAMERSPSASESELSMESPRPELLEQIRSSMAREHEKNLLAERKKWEERLSQISAEHKSQLDDLIAEKQVSFNEVLNSVVEEKDGTIKSLRQELKDLKSTQQQQSEEEEMSKSRLFLLECGADQKSGDESEDDLSRLKKENQRLKELMSKRMSENFSCGKINVSSADIGDCVMVLWDSESEHYIIYNEKSHCIFLHSDSIPTLGLSPSNRFTTGIIVDGEYCVTRRANNRFKLPSGTRFRRVKCKPMEIRRRRNSSRCSSLSESNPPADNNPE